MGDPEYMREYYSNLTHIKEFEASLKSAIVPFDSLVLTSNMTEEECMKMVKEWKEKS